MRFWGQRIQWILGFKLLLSLGFGATPLGPLTAKESNSPLSCSQATEAFGSRFHSSLSLPQARFSETPTPDSGAEQTKERILRLLQQDRTESPPSQSLSHSLIQMGRKELKQSLQAIRSLILKTDRALTAEDLTRLAFAVIYHPRLSPKLRAEFVSIWIHRMNEIYLDEIERDFVRGALVQLIDRAYRDNWQSSNTFEEMALFSGDPFSVLLGASVRIGRWFYDLGRYELIMIQLVQQIRKFPFVEYSYEEIETLRPILRELSHFEHQRHYSDAENFSPEYEPSVLWMESLRGLGHLNDEDLIVQTRKLFDRSIEGRTGFHQTRPSVQPLRAEQIVGGREPYGRLSTHRANTPPRALSGDVVNQFVLRNGFAWFLDAISYSTDPRAIETLVESLQLTPVDGQESLLESLLHLDNSSQFWLEILLNWSHRLNRLRTTEPNSESAEFVENWFKIQRTHYLWMDSHIVGGAAVESSMAYAAMEAFLEKLTDLSLEDPGIFIELMLDSPLDLEGPQLIRDLANDLRELPLILKRHFATASDPLDSHRVTRPEVPPELAPFLKESAISRREELADRLDRLAEDLNRRLLGPDEILQGIRH